MDERFNQTISIDFSYNTYYFETDHWDVHRFKLGPFLSKATSTHVHFLIRFIYVTEIFYRMAAISLKFVIQKCPFQDKRVPEQLVVSILTFVASTSRPKSTFWKLGSSTNMKTLVPQKVLILHKHFVNGVESPCFIDPLQQRLALYLWRHQFKPEKHLKTQFYFKVLVAPLLDIHSCPSDLYQVLYAMAW